MSRKKSKRVFDIPLGGFNDLASFRAELGADAAGISDADALKIIDENLREKAKLTYDQRANLDEIPADEYKDTIEHDLVKNLRSRADAEEREKQRLAAELSSARAQSSSTANELSSVRSALEIEKLKRMYGDKYIYLSPSSINDFLVKERLKGEIRDELALERERERLRKSLYKPITKPRVKSKSKSASKPKSKPKVKAKTKTTAKAKPKTK
mgnify:CR=1 FL=1